MNRMIEVNGRRYWLETYRNGWRADEAYYTRGYDEDGKTILTEEVFSLYDQCKPTPSEALDAAEAVVRSRLTARTVTVHTYTDDERAAQLAEADRQARIRDAAPLARSNRGFSLFKAS